MTAAPVAGTPGPGSHSNMPRWAYSGGADAGPPDTLPAPANRQTPARPGTYPARRRSRRPPEWPPPPRSWRCPWRRPGSWGPGCCRRTAGGQ